MMTATRQTVTVQQDGRLDLAVPALRQGTVAEVIVLVEAARPDPLAIAERLAKLNRLRDAVQLTDEQAAKWVEDIRLERLAWNRPANQSDR